MGVYKGILAVLDWFFPPRCPVCDKVLKKQEKICRNCEKELEWIKEPKCFKCGKPIGEMEQEYCSDCLRTDFHYTKGYALWVYEGAARKSVTAFKYKGRQEYAGFYGEAFLKVHGKELKRLCLNTIIPVPVHRERKRIRGYNQAELFARELSLRLGIPMETNALLRVQSTRPQKGLGYRERQKNLEKAFQFYPEYCRKRSLGKVLLVDDIYTTGSTAEICARILLQAGAKEVYVAALCIGEDTRR